MISRLAYYLRSLPTLLGQIRNWYILPLLPFRQQSVINLRRGPSFIVRGLMDTWIIKETCLDRDSEVYGVPLENGWTYADH